MEILTTADQVNTLPERIRQLHIPKNTSIRVIVNMPEPSIVNAKASGARNLNLPFLDDDIWDDEGEATDIAQNHDHYLYDLEQPHGKK